MNYIVGPIKFIAGVIAGIAMTIFLLILSIPVSIGARIVQGRWS